MKKYETLQLEILNISEEDIITASIGEKDSLIFDTFDEFTQ